MSARSFLLSLALLGLSMPVIGQELPTPLSADTKLVVYNYDENNTFQILTRPKSVTHIQLQADEVVEDMAAGDSSNWVFERKRNHVFIRPKFEGLESSATLLTNLRVYQLRLKSGREGTGRWYQRVTFEVPGILLFQAQQSQESNLQSKESPVSTNRDNRRVFRAEVEESPSPTQRLEELSDRVHLDKLNMAYKIEGDAPFRPLRVFDDGKFTRIQLPQNLQDVPACFLLNNDGDAELVNYSPRGDYLIVHRIAVGILLKIGKQEVRITNLKLKPKRWWNSGEDNPASVNGG